MFSWNNAGSIEREEAISFKIRKLNEEYQERINHRLKMREFMKKVVVTWLNARLSRACRHWKKMSVQLTEEELILLKKKEEVRKVREHMLISIKGSREKLIRRANFVGYKLRLERKMSNDLINRRKHEDLRLKTARAQNTRNLLKTSKTSRVAFAHKTLFS